MNNNTSSHTQRAYRTAVKDFQIITGGNLDNLKSGLLEKWDHSMRTRGLSVSTRRQRLSLILRKNSSIDFPLPEREQLTPRYLSKKQVEKLLSSIPKNLAGHLDFFLFSLFLLTGWRNSQIRNLCWEQLLQNDDLFFIEKGDR